MRELVNESLNTQIKPWGFSLNEYQLTQLNQYIHLLMKWAKVINLTAITEPNDIVTKHILDSLSIIPYLRAESISPLIDVGSGAGLPGIMVAVVFPHKQITLLDSRLKKTQFLKQVVYTLNLKNVTVVHARVEQYQPEILFQGVMARAVSDIKKFVNLTKDICAPDGFFYLMKGRDPSAELADFFKDPLQKSKGVEPELSSETETEIREIKVIPLRVPNLHAERNLVIIPKQCMIAGKEK